MPIAALSPAFSGFSGPPSSAGTCCPGAPAGEQTSRAQPDEQTRLTDEEQREVQELQKRDREVRAHEQAHIAAGGSYVRGGASFEYQTGPDGKRYAVGGEVSIDTSEVSDDPRATIRKMQVVRKAALAPANPSAQDRSVAAAASQKMAQARQELQKQRSQEDETAHTHPSEKSTQAPPSSQSSHGYTARGQAVRGPAQPSGIQLDLAA